MNINIEEHNKIVEKYNTKLANLCSEFEAETKLPILGIIVTPGIEKDGQITERYVNLMTSPTFYNGKTNDN